MQKNTLEQSMTHSNGGQGVFSSLIYAQRFVPAVLAVCIQITALFVVLLLILVFNFVIPAAIPFFVLVLAQSAIAAIFSVLVGMASWWRWIHFLFPLTLWLMSRWQIPNDLYLLGFLVSLSLFWTTFHSQVPFFPSRPMVWKKLETLLPKDQPRRMIDIGSGLGDLVMHLAQLRPESRIEGIEIAPLPWVVSVLRGLVKHSRAHFKRGNYHALNFTDYDVVFAYLSPAAMPALWDKAQTEMRHGTLLVSYEFDIPGIKPSRIIGTKTGSPKIFVWEM